jgi:hypothetical protein
LSASDLWASRSARGAATGILRNILTDLGPVYVKLGQLLSTRPDLLPPEYIEALSSLQSNVPVVSPAEIARFIYDVANRRSLSTLAGSLAIGAAIVSTAAQTSQMQLIGNVLFSVAGLLGLWLVWKIVRSGKLK